ncbi:hypothetical protein Efla_001457 [Eimeria flavescens]
MSVRFGRFQQIFSKLTCGRWPTPDAVAQRIQRALHEPSNFRDDGKLISSAQVQPIATAAGPTRPSSSASSSRAIAPAHGPGAARPGGEAGPPAHDELKTGGEQPNHVSKGSLQEADTHQGSKKHKSKHADNSRANSEAASKSPPHKFSGGFPEDPESGEEDASTKHKEDAAHADAKKKKKKEKDGSREPPEAGHAKHGDALHSESEKKKKEKDETEEPSEAAGVKSKDAASSEAKKKKKKEKDESRDPLEAGHIKSEDSVHSEGKKKKKKEKDEKKEPPEAAGVKNEDAASAEAKIKKKKEKNESWEPSDAGDLKSEDSVQSEGKKKKKKKKDTPKESAEAGDGKADDSGGAEGKKKKKHENNEAKEAPTAGGEGGADAANSEHKKKKKKEKDETGGSGSAGEGGDALAGSENKKEKKKKEKENAPQEMAGREEKADSKSIKQADEAKKDARPKESGIPSFSSHPAAPLTRNYELTLPVGTKQTQRLSYQNPNPSALDLLLVSSEPELMAPNVRFDNQNMKDFLELPTETTSNLSAGNSSLHWARERAPK